MTKSICPPITFIMRFAPGIIGGDPFSASYDVYREGAAKVLRLSQRSGFSDSVLTLGSEYMGQAVGHKAASPERVSRCFSEARNCLYPGTEGHWAADVQSS